MELIDKEVEAVQEVLQCYEHSLHQFYPPLSFDPTHKVNASNFTSLHLSMKEKETASKAMLNMKIKCFKLPDVHAMSLMQQRQLKRWMSMETLLERMISMRLPMSSFVLSCYAQQAFTKLYLPQAMEFLLRVAMEQFGVMNSTSSSPTTMW